MMLTGLSTALPVRKEREWRHKSTLAYGTCARAIAETLYDSPKKTHEILAATKRDRRAVSPMLGNMRVQGLVEMTGGINGRRGTWTLTEPARQFIAEGRKESDNAVDLP